MSKNENLSMKVCIRNITKFNEKWFTLPIEKDELDKFLRSGNDEYIIVDHDLPFECSEYSNIETLNNFYESCIDSNLSLLELKILFKFGDTVETTIEKINNSEFTIVEISYPNEPLKFIDESDIAMFLHDNEYTAILGNVPEHLYDFIDWDQVWRECNISEKWNYYFDEESGSTYAVNI